MIAAEAARLHHLLAAATTAVVSATVVCHCAANDRSKCHCHENCDAILPCMFHGKALSCL
jgi:hypothetical protein